MSFYLNFDLKNPFFKSSKSSADSLHSKSFSVSKTRSIELSARKHAASHLIGVVLDLRMSGGDHAGPNLDITVLGWSLEIGLPDARHWNYTDDCWLMFWKDWEKEFNSHLAEIAPDKEIPGWNNVWQYHEYYYTPKEAAEAYAAGEKADIDLK